MDWNDIKDLVYARNKEALSRIPAENLADAILNMYDLYLSPVNDKTEDKVLNELIDDYAGEDFRIPVDEQKPKQRAGRKRKYSTDIRNEVRNMRRTGMTYQQISDACGISWSTVRRISKE